MNLSFLFFSVVKAKYYKKISVKQEIRVTMSNQISRIEKLHGTQLGTYNPLVSDWGYLRIKNILYFFNLSVVLLHMTTKLLIKND